MATEKVSFSKIEKDAIEISKIEYYDLPSEEEWLSIQNETLTLDMKNET